MALVDCESLSGLTEAFGGAESLPELAQTGLSPDLAQELSAHATATPMATRDVVSADALAAAGGVPGALGRARDWVLAVADGPRQTGAWTEADEVSVPASYHFNAAAAVAMAAADAQAQGAATEAAVRDRIAGGEDAWPPASVPPTVDGIATAVLARFADNTGSTMAALTGPSVTAASGNGPLGTGPMGTLPSWTAPFMTAPPEISPSWTEPAGNGPAATMPRPARGWGTLSMTETPQTPAAAQVGAIASRWTSLRAGVPPVDAPPDVSSWRDGDTWIALGPSVALPPLPAPESEPIAPPPFNVAAMAALASVASLFRAAFGSSLANPEALDDLAETIESFNDSLARQPPVIQQQPGTLSGWGALARGVGAVRERMGVDLLQPGGGEAFSAAIMERQALIASGIAVWQEERARAVMEWLVLDQAAAALGLPTGGPGALRTLGWHLRQIADADMPDCVDPMATASMLAMLDNAQSIKTTFGVDALSPGGADSMRAIGASVRRNLSGRMRWVASTAPTPSMTLGLSYPALDRFSRIDRTQGGDLGLGGLTPETGPMFTSAPAVLGVLSAAHDFAGRRVTRRGRGRPRRSYRSGRGTTS